jgi:hypothetical protein
MPTDRAQAVMRDRAARVAEILETLAARGMSQRQVAFELNVPAQYLSDVKNARRNLSEPLARRFAEISRISTSWLLWGEGPMQSPGVAAAPPPSFEGTCFLPVLSVPCQGEPRESPHWDGTWAPVTGAAAAAAQRAKLPFVLRVGDDDRSGRLHRGDLVLCSQAPCEDAAIVIVLAKNNALLARQGAANRLEPLHRGIPIREGVVIGRCLAVIWSPL